MLTRCLRSSGGWVWQMFESVGDRFNCGKFAEVFCLIAAKQVVANTISARSTVASLPSASFTKPARERQAAHRFDSYVLDERSLDEQSVETLKQRLMAKSW